MMKRSNGETDFLLRRAEEEAVLALTADQEEAAAVHQELSTLYSERARRALAEAPRPVDPVRNPPMPTI